MMDVLSHQSKGPVLPVEDLEIRTQCCEDAQSKFQLQIYSISDISWKFIWTTYLTSNVNVKLSIFLKRSQSVRVTYLIYKAQTDAKFCSSFKPFFSHLSITLGTYLQHLNVNCLGRIECILYMTRFKCSREYFLSYSLNIGCQSL